jgi:outer membrane protein
MQCLLRFPTLMGVVCSCSVWAQTPDITIQEPAPIPVIGRILRPFHFEKRVVSQANLANTPRLQSLVRGGNLYLSSQDVIALVLENNIDIAVQRYGPYLAKEVLRRAEGGGFLRNLGLPVSAGPVSVSLAGVNATAVGLAESGSGVGSGGGIVTQLGTPPPPLDPFLFAYGNYSHTTTPQSNTILSGTPFFLNDSRTYQFGYGQTFLTGTSAQATYTSYRSTVNSLYNVLSPYTSTSIDLYITQPVLQGFGVAVNNRNIRVAKNNMKVTDLQLKRQVITTVSAVLNLYWDLVSFNEDMRIKGQAVEAAQKLFDDNKKQVALGTLASIEVTRAAAELSSSKEELLISETNVSQQETVLKNALSRNGVESAWLDEVHIMTLDRIEVPKQEDLKPTGELIQQALANRPEVEQTRVNVDSKRININGTRNALLPSLQAFVDLTNNGLTGDLNKVYNGANGPPDPYLLGGYGNALGQLARRNFPNYAVGFSLNIPFRNRSAQADYVADQLDLRQSELLLQKSASQVRVDVKNAVIGLQQARARYETATATRTLAQETLTAEQNRFKFGESTIAQVVQAQRDLGGDQSAEVQALANYTHAKIAFDESVGQTLEVNHISMSDAIAGQVGRPSSIPDGSAR